MQKKIIALAVAGLSTAAIAQTNVTIYGVADVSAQGTNMSKGVNPSSQPSGGSFNMKNNSSLIGFKGTEDLGNGLKGLFQMETNVNITGGSSAVSSSNQTSTAGNMFTSMRDSYVGVNSKYGTAMGGYLSTPYRSALTSFDVMPGATGDGRNENLIGKMGGSGSALASSVRATAIAYALPTMYGFNGAIAYTGSSSNGDNENTATSQILKQALSLNLGWEGYGFGIKGAFQQAKIGGATGSAVLANTVNAGNPQTFAKTANISQTYASGYTSYLIGVQYTGVPGLKLAALYNRNTLGVNTATTAGTTVASVDNASPNKGSNNQYWLGASYRFGNNEPRISWAQTSNTNFNGFNANDGGRQITANWGYYLSKRTQVYGIISSIKNNQDAAWYMASQGTGLTPTAGQTLLTYGAGMRTNF